MRKLRKFAPQILIAVFILSLIPLFILAFYNHPAHDDYYYGIKTHLAAQSGNLIDVISAAISEVKETYRNWQGTYSAVFLFSLQPAIFGERYYVISTFIFLPALIASSLLFSHTLVRKIFGASRRVFILTSVTTLLLSVHLAPSPVQSYYWYNASVYYTLFYSFSLVLFSTLYYIIISEKLHTKIILEITAIILAVIIGGGNYVTALLTAIVLFCVEALLIFTKNRRSLWILPIFVTFIAAFLVSILAPGNAVRAENYDDISVIASILLSIRYALYYSAKWLDVTGIVALLLLTPFLARAAARSKFSFRYPIIAVVFLFLVFAAQFCPPIYAMSTFGDGEAALTSGEARILNIIYYSYFHFSLIAIYYISGSVARKHGDFTKPIFDYIYSSKGVALISALVAIAVILPAVAPSGEMEEYYGGGTAFTGAIYSLASGEAAKWNEENNERYALLTNQNIKHVEFQPFTAKPAMLFYGDLTQDENWMWSNEPMRVYFNKKSVITRWY